MVMSFELTAEFINLRWIIMFKTRKLNLLFCYFSFMSTISSRDVTESSAWDCRKLYFLSVLDLFPNILRDRRLLDLIQFSVVEILLKNFIWSNLYLPYSFLPALNEVPLTIVLFWANDVSELTKSVLEDFLGIWWIEFKNYPL